jgi:hypothetical protein
MEAEQAQQVGFYFGVIFGSLLVGMILGLIPWFYGRHRGMNGVASAGMLACVVGQFLFGLRASLPLAVVFAIAIAVLPAPKKKKRRTDPARNLAPRPPRAPYEV